MTPKLLFALLATGGLFFPSVAPAQIQVNARLNKNLAIGVQFDPFHRHHSHHHHARAGGHWQTTHERVWVPGGARTVHHPAVYGWIYDGCGRKTWGIIVPARCEVVNEPGRWECHERRVWVSY